MCILLEINECNLPNACPENANCNDLIGRCEYVCKDGFQRQESACNGKQYLIFENKECNIGSINPILLVGCIYIILTY